MNKVEANAEPSKHLFDNLSIEIAFVWLLALFALAFAGWVGEFAEVNWNTDSRTRYLLQALIMSGIVVPSIWIIAMRSDRNLIEEIGLTSIGNALAKFGLGFGFVLFLSY